MSFSIFMLSCIDLRSLVFVLSVFVDRNILLLFFFFFQAEDGIRDLVRSRGLGDVYKRQLLGEAIILGLSVELGFILCAGRVSLGRNRNCTGLSLIHI